jgi:hypothetical protein
VTNRRWTFPILCASVLIVAAGCSESLPQGPADAPGSKAAGSPAPKNLPKGVKLGEGTAVVQ